MNWGKFLEDALPLILALLGLIQTYASGDPKWAALGTAAGLAVKTLKSLTASSPSAQPKV